MDFLRALISAPISIIVLFILSKLIGNKQMADLTMFDFVNGITIGSIAAEMATSEGSKFYSCLIALVIYALVVILLSFLSQKSLFLRRIFTGTTIILYDRGKIFKKNFKTAKIDMNEFLTMLRNQGFFCLDDVETAFLEQTGMLSVLPKDSKRPVTPDDLKIRVTQTRAEIVVISNGKILQKNLKATGNNMDWLNKELQSLGQQAKNVFFAVCDNNNNLKIYPCSNEEYSGDLFE